MQKFEGGGSMLRQLLIQHYGIITEEEVNVGRYKACKRNGEIYLVIPVGSLENEELSELEQIAVHLMNKGDRHVAAFVHTKEGALTSNWNEKNVCVLLARNVQPLKKISPGRKLAKLHYRGRTIPFQVKKIARIGQWKILWEKRLDQMERIWKEKLFQQPENEFEKMFLESFPYYMGLTENAIQYLVDTELDAEPVASDGGTVCHERFSESLWTSHYFKNPFDWVFDHSSRDIAEWIRGRYFANIKTYEPDVKQFLNDYQSISPLSPFSWRLLYSRILFPLHFFDCVESYYITNSEQERHMLEDHFLKFLSQSSEYERFLGNFYQLAEVPVQKYQIPRPEWLARP
jgi:spore coat protein YutH